MSEVPLISTEKQAELLQSSDISKEFFEKYLSQTACSVVK